MKFVMMDQVVGMFASFGLAAFFSYLVATVEVIGGIAMLFGFLARYAGIALAIVMLFAIILVKGKMGFGAVQVDLMLLVSSLGIALIGPGNWALGKDTTCGCCKDCENGMCANPGVKCDGCTDCASKCSGHEMKK